MEILSLNFKLLRSDRFRQPMKPGGPPTWFLAPLDCYKILALYARLAWDKLLSMSLERDSSCIDPAIERFKDGRGEKE